MTKRHIGSSPDDLNERLVLLHEHCDRLQLTGDNLRAQLPERRVLVMPEACGDQRPNRHGHPTRPYRLVMSARGR